MNMTYTKVVDHYEDLAMNKEIPPESSSTSSRRNRRHASAPSANFGRRVNQQPSYRDFLNMFADLDLARDRVTDETHRTFEPAIAIPEMPVLPPRADSRGETAGRIRAVADMMPPTLPLHRFMSPLNNTAGNPVEEAAVDDDASFGSLPALIPRVDSSDEDSLGDEESYGSLPSLVTRSDSSDDDDDDDDCTLPSLISQDDDEEDSLPPLLRRRNNHTLENVGRLYGELRAIRGVPPLLQRRLSLFQRSGDSDSDDDSDDDSNCSSDDSSESDGETYWEAAELEMETSNNRFDNEAIVDDGSSMSISQRRVNRFSGSSSVRRNLSRVRCRCLARVTNAQAWITLRDNMRVRRTVQ